MISDLPALWARVYNPNSMYPDISLGKLLDVMVEILAEADTRDLTPNEKKVLARTEILGGCDRTNLVFSTTEDAPFLEYDDFNEVLGVEDQNKTNAENVIDHLIGRGYLVPIPGEQPGTVLLRDRDHRTNGVG